MQRHELIAQLGQLKLHGMASAFDEAVIQGVRRQLTVQEILARLCQAEVAERTARSVTDRPNGAGDDRVNGARRTW